MASKDRIHEWKVEKQQKHQRGELSYEVGKEIKIQTKRAYTRPHAIFWGAIKPSTSIS